MARSKAYNEDEVIEKATDLFWRKGYEATSMRELEGAMGINKFSIYSSFGSKQGVFLESLRCYRKKYEVLVDKLKVSARGTAAIKEFFYDFIDFSKDYDIQKGCLLTSTAGEFGAKSDTLIMSEVLSFTDNLKSVFIEKLESDENKDKALINRQANYLIIAKQGLSNASKVADRETLEDFIETTFEHILEK